MHTDPQCMRHLNNQVSGVLSSLKTHVKVFSYEGSFSTRGNFPHGMIFCLSFDAHSPPIGLFSLNESFLCVGSVQRAKFKGIITITGVVGLV